VRKILILFVLGVVALLSSGMSAGAGTTTHQPHYMPNADNIANPALQPPPVCCSPVGPPVAGEPAPVNMAYFGGHVQVTPKIYLVFWGWGQAGAFNHTTPGMPTNDPDGAAARMTAFVKAMGGTAWAGSQTQYYETVNGQGGLQQRRRLLRVARLHAAAVLPRRPARHLVHEHAVRPQLGLELRRELRQHRLLRRASRRVHDRDGHEIEETITDPGAEDVINGVNLGGWYDYAAYENGDKCAWVGYTEGIAPPNTVPGGLNNITGNDGKQYPVQSLWSNGSTGGTGWCAGAGDDLPVTG
jgi:hypothetical protein